MAHAPRLIITMGDINGVGPEIVAKAAADRAFWQEYRPVVFGSMAAYEAAAREVNAPPAHGASCVDDAFDVREGVAVMDLGLEVPKRRPGELDAEAGRCAMEWVREAVRLAMEGTIDGVVTCPINKLGIYAAGYTAPGHTEFVAELTGAPDHRMCLFSDLLRIVHVSGHMALRDALDCITIDRVAASIRMGHGALLRLGTRRRRIAVAGLNPHAGEDGAFGTEEAEHIAPAIAQCEAEGIDCSGPYSPDTVFKRTQDGEFDLVVAMYHDQGHIPGKLVDMDSGVNVTLGLPIVRTSVDHGTAYDIAGKNVARQHSLCAAIRLAARFVGAARETRAS